MQIEVTTEMATELAQRVGGSRERRCPVGELRFLDGSDSGNVLSAIGVDGEYLFDLAYRPHYVGQYGYDKHGLFFC